MGAQTTLGRMYLEGRHVAADPQRAAELLGEAAAAGHPAAQTVLGLMYQKGQGVPVDTGSGSWWKRHLRGVEAHAGQALEEGLQTISPYVELMFIHTIRGEEEKAVDALASATGRNFLPYPWFDFFAQLERTRERLRDNERFREILRDLEARTDSLRAEAERRRCVR